MTEKRYEALFTTASAATGSVTISARQGMRIALRLFWDSLRGWRRGKVTFYFFED